MKDLLLEAPPAFGVVQSQPDFRTHLIQTGAFVAQEKLNKLYGVQALHGHYEVASDELVLEFVMGETLQTRVVSNGEVAHLVPTMWGFTTEGIHVPIQWSADVSSDDTLDTDLEHIGQFLAANRLTCTFSVVQLPLALRIVPGETVLFEETNKSTRTQISHLMPRSLVPSCDDATWMFADDGTPVAIACCRCWKCGRDR